MPILRPSTATRALSMTKSRTTATAPGSSGRRMLSNTSRRAAASGAEVSDSEHEHEQHHQEERFDPPSGWLWGIRPGEKYEKEGWENIWFYGMFGSLGVAVVAYAFKPDTSIQTWALEEARRRLEVEGILKEPDDKP